MKFLLFLLFLTACASFSVNRSDDLIRVSVQSRGLFSATSTKPITKYSPPSCKLLDSVSNGKNTAIECPTPNDIQFFTTGTVVFILLDERGIPISPQQVIR